MKSSKGKRKKWAELIAKTWVDEEFKKKFLKNPHLVFKELGIEIPENQSLTVLEETEEKKYFILPQKPSREIPKEQFFDIAMAGACGYPPTSPL